MVKMSMLGIPEMTAKIAKFQQQFPELVMQATRIEAEIEATECKKRCPVYTGPSGPGKPIPGVLRASIHVEGPTQDGTHVRCSIVAGGAAGAYALRQHEELDWFHTVGEPKYIESVIKESRASMAGRIAARIDISQEL